MIARIIHIITFLSFLNMLTFDKSRHMEMLFGQDEIVTDTLMEYILEDFMDIDGNPIADPEDPDIIYEDYRDITMSLSFILPIFLFLARDLFINIERFLKFDHPNYDSKMCSEPGYYTFLYRLRPF